MTLKTQSQALHPTAILHLTLRRRPEAPHPLLPPHPLRQARLPLRLLVLVHPYANTTLKKMAQKMLKSAILITTTTPLTSQVACRS